MIFGKYNLNAIFRRQVDWLARCTRPTVICQEVLVQLESDKDGASYQCLLVREY